MDLTDVFGRNTYSDGHWNTNATLDILRQNGVSIAVIDLGWLYETKQGPDFETALNRCWGLVEKSWGTLKKYPGVLPFYTNVDLGRGYHNSVEGDKVSNVAWCNIYSQSIQSLIAFADYTANLFQNIVVRSVLTANGSAGNHLSLAELKNWSIVKGACFYAITAFNDTFLFVLMLVGDLLVLLLDCHCRKFHHFVAKVWAKLTVVQFYKIKLEGLENCPPLDTSLVYVSNLQSFIDIYSPYSREKLKIHKQDQDIPLP
ncbi:hypothetical protein RIF29_15569 [Crotalaria pallida]|uniref:Cytosolic endo-beta-N-acetylglucosaminidase TIM barrel domain-containing protein n=1 Tax=Crotalaria pallida TaxID=3830 RepID=A0AAN9ICQ1_CROPI